MSPQRIRKMRCVGKAGFQCGIGNGRSLQHQRGRQQQAAPPEVGAHGHARMGAESVLEAADRQPSTLRQMRHGDRFRQWGRQLDDDLSDEVIIATMGARLIGTKYCRSEVREIDTFSLT